MDSRGFEADLVFVVLLVVFVFVTALAGTNDGKRIGRCEATCASIGAERASNDGDACWCEGADQPVRSLGSK